MKPDFIIWNKITSEALIIEISVPSDFGLNAAEQVKKLNLLFGYYRIKNIFSVSLVVIINDLFVSFKGEIFLGLK